MRVKWTYNDIHNNHGNNHIVETEIHTNNRNQFTKYFR